MATILSGTEAEFDVGYNDEKRLITISSKTALSGSPTLIQLDSNDVALPNEMTVMVDGLYLAPTAYNIDGFTYFKLRDIGQILDFGVDWDADAQSMVITTDGDAIINSLMAPVTIAK